MAHFDWTFAPSQDARVLAKNVVATSQPRARPRDRRVCVNGGNAVDAALAAAPRDGHRADQQRHSDVLALVWHDEPSLRGSTPRADVAAALRPRALRRREAA